MRPVSHNPSLFLSIEVRHQAMEQRQALPALVAPALEKSVGTQRVYCRIDYVLVQLRLYQVMHVGPAKAE